MVMQVNYGKKYLQNNANNRHDFILIIYGIFGNYLILILKLKSALGVLLSISLYFGILNIIY